MSDAAREPETWTIGELLRRAAEYLGDKGLDEPRLSAEILLAHVIGCSRLELYTRWAEAVDDTARAAYRDLIRRAAGNEPIAYIVGYKEFFSLEFEVTPDVLIPRPETELLVDRVIEYCKSDAARAWRILEPGTGSGCIAVAVAKSVPNAEVLATEASAGAVQVAQRNVVRHGLQQRVRVVQADWLELPGEFAAAGWFDVIVSNPPYIAEGDLASLPETVRKYEPEEALLGGPDGLAYYRATAAQARDLLRPEGVVLLEVGYGQGRLVAEIFAAAGWQLTGQWKDLAGIERVVQFARRDG